MGQAKAIVLKPIPSRLANAFIRQHHYSGKVVQNAQLHLGVYWQNKLQGAMQFGSPLDKRKVLPLVEGTQWHEMMELNRLAFTDVLPRNSESRALAIAFKLIRKHAPQVKWILSFADATRCGDGTIYRASGFVLTAIKENSQLYKLPFADAMDDKPLLQAGLTDTDILVLRQWLRDISKEGDEHKAHRLTVEDRPPHKMSLEGAPHAHKMSLQGGQRPSQLLSQVKRIMRRVTNGKTSADTLLRLMGGEPTKGYQLRYIKFIDPSWRNRLTCEALPYEAIQDAGAGMYKGVSQHAGN